MRVIASTAALCYDVAIVFEHVYVVVLDDTLDSVAAHRARRADQDRW